MGEQPLADEHPLGKHPTVAPPALQPVALITGAAGGLGQAISSALSANGFFVFNADLPRDPQAISPPTDPKVARAIALDVTQPESWSAAAHAVQQCVGRLDLLVNNAGILATGDVEQTIPDDWARIINVNLTGAFLGIRAFTPLLRASRGSVVNISSVVGIHGNTRMVAYAASKAGLLGLTYAAAKDFARDGVRVNAVCPGTAETAMSEAFFGEGPDGERMRAQSVAKHPLGRLATPADVAAAVVYLASASAGFITGIALPVDGGRLLG